MNTQVSTPNLQTPRRIDSQVDYVLLDGSGSMVGKWFDSLSAIDSYIAQLQAGNINSQILLQIFDTTNRGYMARDLNIRDWKPLSQDPPGLYYGSTPLFDAINIMGRKMRDLDPPRASILIVTDGSENASTFTDQTQARSILDWCRAKGWQVTFIGAEFDNSGQAARLGATPQSSIGVSKKLLSAATSALGAKRTRYGLYGDPMYYTDDEKQQFGGFLSGPTH